MKWISFVLATVALIEAKPYHSRPFTNLDLGKGHSNGFGFESGIGDEIDFMSELPPDVGLGFENGIGPQRGLGFGNVMRLPGMRFEPGMGTGMGLQPGMGLGRGYGRQFSNGQEYGRQQFNNGASGFAQQAVKNAAGKHYHNIGAHHRKETSIHQVEDDERHNIGSDSAFNMAAQSSGGFKNYQNGASRYGNQYGQGEERLDY